MPQTVESTRFGALEIAEESIIEFPDGLIGIGGSRYALLAKSEDSAFVWLHSLDEPALAIPVTNPFRFFADYEVVISDSEAERIGIHDPAECEVWVTVRANGDAKDFSVNLLAPILVQNGHGHQVINELPGTSVRAALFADDAAGQAA